MDTLRDPWMRDADHRQPRGLGNTSLCGLPPAPSSDPYRDGQANESHEGKEQMSTEAVIDRNALTRREIEVLLLMADGLSNKLIAAEMGISDHTVKFHVENVIRKMGRGNRVGAVVEGFRRGLVV